MSGAALDDRASAADLVSKRLLLRKPFGPAQLVSIVREHLEAGSQSAQGF